jgi:hypothetical protein
MSFADHSDFHSEPNDERRDPSTPPVRTFANDLTDVERYRDLRRELVVLREKMRSLVLPPVLASAYWADHLTDLLARYPEPPR